MGKASNRKWLRRNGEGNYLMYNCHPSHGKKWGLKRELDAIARIQRFMGHRKFVAVSARAMEEIIGSQN